MWRALSISIVAVTLGGCSTLFPEFFGGSNHDAAVIPDSGSGDGGTPATPHLTGVACIIADARDYRSCRAGSPGVLRITVEETRDQVMSDVTGHFTLPLSSVLTSATVAAIDPRGVYAPSIIPLRITGGVADNVVLPIVQAQTLSNLALQNGQTLEPQNGSLLLWAIDTSGAPIAGVTFGKPDALVDGPSPGELDAGSRTGARGAIAILQAAPTTFAIALAPPSTLALRGDRYNLPVRAGALTVSTLVLAPQ